MKLSSRCRTTKNGWMSISAVHASSNYKVTMQVHAFTWNRPNRRGNGRVSKNGCLSVHAKRMPFSVEVSLYIEYISIIFKHQASSIDWSFRKRLRLQEVPSTSTLKRLKKLPKSIKGVLQKMLELGKKKIECSTPLGNNIGQQEASYCFTQIPHLEGRFP